MYLSDFIELDGERFYVSVDTKKCRIGLSRVRDEAYEKFITNIINHPFALDDKNDDERRKSLGEAA